MEVFFNKPIHHCKTTLLLSLISFDLANIVLCSMGLFSAEFSFDSVLTHLALSFILGDWISFNFFQSFYKREEYNLSTLSVFYLLGKWPSSPIAARFVIL